MATITVRNLDDEVKSKLHIRAAQNGRSMEAEARAILETVLNAPNTGRNFAQALRDAALAVGGVDLELPDRREMTRDPFAGWTDEDFPGE